MAYREPKYIALRMGLISILVAIFVGSYIFLLDNYKRVELSQKMVSALLDNKIELARKYANQLGAVQKNLDQTEDFLKDIREENFKLKEKIKLLDQMKDMEREIVHLKEENKKIQNAISEAVPEKKEQKKDKFMFKTIAQGRGLLKEFKQKICQVKYRIHSLKEKEYAKKASMQQEIDRKETLLGNNGYLMKGGKALPVSMPDVKNLPDKMRIKVEFVK